MPTTDGRLSRINPEATGTRGCSSNSSQELWSSVFRKVAAGAARPRDYHKTFCRAATLTRAMSFLCALASCYRRARPWLMDPPSVVCTCVCVGQSDVARWVVQRWGWVFCVDVKMKIREVSLSTFLLENFMCTYISYSVFWEPSYETSLIFPLSRRTMVYFVL